MDEKRTTYTYGSLLLLRCSRDSLAKPFCIVNRRYKILTFIFFFSRPVVILSEFEIRLLRSIPPPPLFIKNYY